MIGASGDVSYAHPFGYTGNVWEEIEKKILIKK